MRFLFLRQIAASVSRQKFARLSRSTMHSQECGLSLSATRESGLVLDRARRAATTKQLKLPGRKNREGSCRVVKGIARTSPQVCGLEIQELQKISTREENQTCKFFPQVQENKVIYGSEVYLRQKNAQYAINLHTTHYARL